jgi:hypothetical protein
MGRLETQKNLAGDVPSALHQAISDWVDEHRNAKLRQVLEAMAEVWLMLPEPMQAILLICKTGSEAWLNAANAVTADILRDQQTLCAATRHPDVVTKNALSLADRYGLAGPWIRTGEDLFWVLDVLYHLLAMRDDPLPVGVPQADKETILLIREALRARIKASSPSRASLARQILSDAERSAQSPRSVPDRQKRKAAE